MKAILGLICGSLATTAALAQDVGTTEQPVEVGAAAPAAEAPTTDASTEAVSSAEAPPAAAESEAPVESANAAPQTIAVDPVAATEPEEASDENRGGRIMQEIIVTAQKREENVQDVPISVQAFSSDVLEARGVSDSLDLPKISPGLVISQIAGFSITYIRGVGTDAFIPSADASIATYVDGVYFPFQQSLVQSFGAVERIEVLKGPQGTLFGRNSTGGAINVITKDPGHDFEGSIDTGYGLFNDLKTRAYVNIPLTDSFAFNISALYNKGNPYYKLTDDAVVDELADDMQKGARLRTKWSVTDDLDISLSGLVLQGSGSSASINQQTDPNPQYVSLGVQKTPKYRSSIDAPAFNTFDNHVGYGSITYRSSWFDTKLMGSYQDISSYLGIDYDASKAPLIAFKARQFAIVDTQEIQLTSNAESLFSDYLTWVAGLYHIKSNSGFNPNSPSVGRDFPAFTGIIGALQDPDDPNAGLGQILELVGGTAGLGSRIDIDVDGRILTDSTAAYFQGTIDLPYEFALTLGGRYQKEDRKLKSSRSMVRVSDSVTIPAMTFADQGNKGSNFSPKFVLDWKPVDDVMTYASYSKGYKSGTYNIINIYTPSQYIKPEVVTTYELGVKSQLLDGNLTLNGAAFNTDIKDLQVQFISLLSGGAARFETAPKARSRGAEFDLLWQIAPEWLPGLVATASGTYLDATYTKYPVASGFVYPGGVPFGGGGFVLNGGVLPGRDFTGNRIVRAPEWSGSFGLIQTLNVPGGSLEVRGDAYYNSGYFYTAQNTEQGEEKAYTLVDAQLSYLYEPWSVRLTLFGRNLTDRLYALNKLPNDIGTWTTYASPRTYGARLSWDF
ncbi:MAG TPA: TonB-dependent receptor [Vicinamibacterales bacterium]|nr:TonB-dependent receptor [Vicinamibacterales bacterium]